MLIGIGLFLQVAVTDAQMGRTVRPESVTVGQHFIATVRVRAATGSTFRFPVRPDSGAASDSAGPSTRSDTTTATYSESTVSYSLAAWDTGAVKLGLGDVTIITPGAGERTISLSDLGIYVRSVLPADTALRKPKPYRPAIAARVVNWLAIIAALAAAALLLLAYYLFRRWRRKKNAPLTPLQWAEQEFARIEASKRIEAGDAEWASIEASTVLRSYLSRVVAGVTLAMTTRELAATYAAGSSEQRAAVVALLDRADMMKFARATSTAEAARQQLSSARDTVRAIDAAVERARTEVAAAARAA